MKVIIRVVAFIAVGIAVYIFYGQFAADSARITELNRLRSLGAGSQWQQTIDGYKAYWTKYPNEKNVDRDQVGNAYLNLAAEKYSQCLTAKTGFMEAAAIYEMAREYTKLDQSGLMSLCDCYVEAGDKAKALAVISEGESRADIGAKVFTTYRKRLAAKP